MHKVANESSLKNTDNTVGERKKKKKKRGQKRRSMQREGREKKLKIERKSQRFFSV